MQKLQQPTTTCLNEPSVRPVSELPVRFRGIFPFTSFNYVQSLTFEPIINTNKPIIVSAPTGSGKTGILELAIIKTLMDCDQKKIDYCDIKIVYLAPTKALCTERREDWSQKFAYLKIQCLELTSDHPNASSFKNMQKATIFLATPEKWDSITRNCLSQRSSISAIRLLLIDEVHLINDGFRGATLEAVISRMKTLRSIIWPDHQENLRFVAISATISNVHDIGEWFSTPSLQAEVFQVDSNQRPVKLRTYVFGYNIRADANDFAFDYLLNSKLVPVIKEYSNQKPTLIFCATRKSCVTTANYLVKEGRFDISYSYDKKRWFYQVSKRCTDKTLQELTRFGIAYHHAGLQTNDRRLIEQAFLEGHIMILCSTSTLAMGVNLPAHLVIIKNTNFFQEAKFVPYSESSLIQMIGRAGRPQFDTEATAVIMTRNISKDNIQNMLDGTMIVESQLHKFLTEHINSEIVLGTIRMDNIAKKWIDSTYLRVRLMKTPENYGLKQNSSLIMKEKALLNWVNESVDKLNQYDLITRNKQQQLEPTEAGRAMARHYICLDTMVKLTNLKGTESLLELLQTVCSCYEVIGDIQVRLEEKSALNNILNPAEEENRLRFPIGDKIDTREKKALALIQVTFGNITMTETLLYQESTRVTRNASRVMNCLKDVIFLKSNLGYNLIVNTLVLNECFVAKLWENSIYVSKQIDKIGAVLSNSLARNGMTTFEALRRANPRNIEIFCNRLPPFGSNVQQTCCGLPIYNLNVRFRVLEGNSSKIQLLVDVILVNGQDLRHVKTLESNHETILVVGNKADNKLLLRSFISDMHLLTRPDLTQTVGADVEKIHLPPDTEIIEAQLISTGYVGLNVKKQIRYSEPNHNDLF